jgi:hypothetical protein
MTSFLQGTQQMLNSITCERRLVTWSGHMLLHLVVEKNDIKYK